MSNPFKQLLTGGIYNKLERDAIRFNDYNDNIYNDLFKDEINIQFNNNEKSLPHEIITIDNKVYLSINCSGCKKEDIKAYSDVKNGYFNVEAVRKAIIPKEKTYNYKMTYSINKENYDLNNVEVSYQDGRLICTFTAIGEKPEKEDNVKVFSIK